jgi:hypothetical protein
MGKVNQEKYDQILAFLEEHEMNLGGKQIFSIDYVAKALEYSNQSVNYYFRKFVAKGIMSHKRWGIYELRE